MKNIVIIVFLLISFADADFIRDDVKEIVIDSETCLMWQDNNASKIVYKNWQDALGYCEELTIGEYDDWRLPNINELGTITDRSRYEPAIQNSFKYVVSNVYWSSTSYSYNYNYAWIIGFRIGHQDYSDKDSYSHVRCVRDGQ